MRVLYFFLFGFSDAMFAALLEACWLSSSAAAEDSDRDDDHLIPERVVCDDELRANLQRFKMRLELAVTPAEREAAAKRTMHVATYPDSPLTDREEPSPASSGSVPRARTASDSIPIPRNGFSFEPAARSVAYSPAELLSEDTRRAMLRRAFVPAEQWGVETGSPEFEVGSFNLLKHFKSVFVAPEVRLTKAAPEDTESDTEGSEQPSEANVEAQLDTEQYMTLFMGDIDEE